MKFRTQRLMLFCLWTWLVGGKNALKISPWGDFPGGPVVKTELPMQGLQVQSLVGELRFYMLRCCVAWPKIKDESRRIIELCKGCVLLEWTVSWNEQSSQGAVRCGIVKRETTERNAEDIDLGWNDTQKRALATLGEWESSWWRTWNRDAGRFACSF